jgi:hypothetical protein
MFCDQCGSALVAGQQYCSGCGKQVIGPVEAGYLRRNRVKEHIRLLGILWLAFAAFNAIAGCVLFVIANTLFRHMAQTAGPEAGSAAIWLRPFLSVIAGLVIIKAVAAFFAGWGLLEREPWGRTIALVMGFIALITNIPLGTALGIYTLWVLLPTQSDEDYRALIQARAAA